MTKGGVRKTVLVVAWVWILGSLFPLIWDMGWPPIRTVSESNSSYVLHATVGEKSYTSWGLTYMGQRGHWLRLAELAGVLVLTVLSLLPLDGARRVGLVGLVAWAGLWLGNALRMAWVAPVWIFLSLAVFMVVFFAATVGRAGVRWRSSRGAFQ